jgi:hypothetical protein
VPATARNGAAEEPRLAEGCAHEVVDTSLLGVHAYAPVVSLVGLAGPVCPVYPYTVYTAYIRIFLFALFKAKK